MKVFLQVSFCLLSCASLIAAFFLGVYVSLNYCFIALAAFVIFGALMFFVKNSGKEKQAPSADFMNSDEENQKILSAQKTAEKQETREKRDK